MEGYRQSVDKAGRADGIVLALIVLAGAGLRLAYLFQPMVHDEAATYVYFASKPLSTGLSYYPYPNNHLLHTLLVHLTTRVFGFQPWAVRLPAFVAGVLLLPAVYLVARRLFGRRPALLATAMAAASTQLIYYSVSARGYTIQALIFLVLVLVAFRLMQGARWPWWLGFGVLAALGFYTVPTFIYCFGALVLWMLLSLMLGDFYQRPKAFVGKLALACVGAAAGTILLYVPVLVKSGWHSLATAKPLAWSRFFGKLPSVPNAVRSTWSAGMPLVIAVIVFLAFLVAVVLHRRLTGRRADFALVALVWCVVLLAAQRVAPPARVFLPLLPLYLAFAAAGLYYVGSRVLAYARCMKGGTAPAGGGAAAVAVALVALIVLGACVVGFDTPYQPRDQLQFPQAGAVAKALKGILKPGDVVYLETNVRKPLEYYFMVDGLPLDYFAGMGGALPPPGSSGNAYLVAVPQKAYPVERTIRESDLRNAGPLEFTEVKRVDGVNIYRVRPSG